MVGIVDCFRDAGSINMRRCPHHGSLLFRKNPISDP